MKISYKSRGSSSCEPYISFQSDDLMEEDDMTSSKQCKMRFKLQLQIVNPQKSRKTLTCQDCNSENLYESSNDVSKIKENLLHLLSKFYNENNTKNLQQNFLKFFDYVDLGMFNEILYESLKILLNKTQAEIHNLIESSSRQIQIFCLESEEISPMRVSQSLSQNLILYEKIFLYLEDRHDFLSRKGREVQEIMNSYLNYNSQRYNDRGIVQKINCQDLFKQQFTDQILRNDKIIFNLLLNLEKVIYEERYSNTLLQRSVRQLALYRNTKSSLPAIVQTAQDRNSQIRHNISQDQRHCTSSRDCTKHKDQYPKSIHITSASNLQPPVQLDKKSEKKKNGVSKKNKKNKENNKNPIKDEIKEFEQKIEQEFEQSKSEEKLKIVMPDNWVDKIKQKLLHSLQQLKYDN